jgi:hypothetical protein
MEILDEKGTVINSYNSETPPGRGGRGAVVAECPELVEPVPRHSPMIPMPGGSKIWTTASASDENRRA